MGINGGSEYADVLTDAYVAGVISVSTTQIEAKVGTSRLENREVLRIFNNSNTTLYFGPSGVTASTGEPLFKNQWINIPIGDIAVFLITASGTASDVRIQELG
jgi:hypothetical protein